MPELPEILSRAREMDAALGGKTIIDIQVLQPKCLNIPAEEFIASLVGASIHSVTNRGKWIFVNTSQGWLLLNLGMGGEILLIKSDALPEKRRLVFEFSDDTCLVVNFWWFGYAHYLPPNGLSEHPMTKDLGVNAIDLDASTLWEKMKGRRGSVKSFLLDQTQVAGIGNAYIHDILFLAGLHPLRRLDTLTEEDAARLAHAIQDGLAPSIAKGGAFYELNLYGEQGGFVMEDILIGYREGQPCPRCGTLIEKIKTGGTSSFICPQCQPLEVF
jgi:formamidopyrimidine-DNA glycosylase